jgi:hypothetical protein
MGTLSAPASEVRYIFKDIDTRSHLKKERKTWNSTPIPAEAPSWICSVLALTREEDVAGVTFRNGWVVRAMEARKVVWFLYKSSYFSWLSSAVLGGWAAARESEAMLVWNDLLSTVTSLKTGSLEAKRFEANWPAVFSPN